jgi:predicted NUDIX family NTP pyrophosphohydrolase
MLKFNNFLNEKKKIDNLSGIVLIINNKILLVKPKKFKKDTDKWSIPKGHLEEDLSNLDNALIELSEETGIKLKKSEIDIDKRTTIFYKKSGTIKKLRYFVIRLNKSEIKKHLTDTKSLKLKNYKSKEIIKAKFFTKDEAKKRIEEGQSSILKNLN